MSGDQVQCGAPDNGDDWEDMTTPSLPLLSAGPGGLLAYDHDGQLAAIYPERSLVPASLPTAGRRIESAVLVGDHRVLVGLEDPAGYAVELVDLAGTVVWERRWPLATGHLSSVRPGLASLTGTASGEDVPGSQSAIPVGHQVMVVFTID
jgi:hypothetical protein